VGETSATLETDENPIELDRKHQLMNKFKDPEDKDYQSVAGKVEASQNDPRGESLQKMDREIRKYYNSEKRLHIERLSGLRLEMDVCYINLAIVEEIKEHGISKKAEGVNATSPFSLTTRPRVEAPDEDIQFHLSDIFEQCPGRKLPSRVLIRGRAGVGKTTLCKKIVHDFLRGCLWNESFDLIFWLPLRRLKSDIRVNDIEELILKEYLVRNTTGNLPKMYGLPWKHQGIIEHSFFSMVWMRSQMNYTDAVQY
jgi:hypothetical protein